MTRTETRHEQATWDAFTEAVTAEEPRYPQGTAFVAVGQADADRIVWRNLRDGTPTVVVGETIEALFDPVQQPPVERLVALVAGRVRAHLAIRTRGDDAFLPVEAWIGRHAVSRSPALAAA